jgi:hypothetical protein
VADVVERAVLAGDHEAEQPISARAVVERGRRSASSGPTRLTITVSSPPVLTGTSG